MLVKPCSHQVVAVAGAARGNETNNSKAKKIECEKKLNDPTTTTTDSYQ